MFDLQVILTKHAIERLAESQLTLQDGLKLIATSNIEILGKSDRSYKQNKYKDHAIYLRNGTFVFTCIKTMDKIRKFEVLLVVTVTNQLITSRVKI